MPRVERPLADGDETVVRFAADLRLLREKAGTPSYRDLGLRAHYSATALSDAASGRKLPSLAVTLAYVAACGGDTGEWEARWRATAAELAAAAPAEKSAESDADRAPYVGLTAFQQEDAGRFFGRDALAAELAARLRQRRFLGVFGASGCGKSSLLRAGLIPRLTGGQQEEDGAPVVVFTPGQHPMEECAVHLARFLDESPETLRDEFAADPRNLHLRIRQAMADAASESDVVLVVDQFEELFTLCADERERAGFVEALVTAASDLSSRTRVVLGVRADFLGHCGRYPDLVTVLRDGQVLVGAMATDELRLAITGPAQQAGYRVETALVARLVADATRQPGMLPLVSHALLQTWLRRQGTVMTVAGYDAAGGIEHALARTADQVYQALDHGQQVLAQQIFLRLTALGEGTEDTKRRITRAELGDDPNTAVVLDTLTRARLITIGHDSVEIAHEALIRHWPRLRDWLAADHEGHRLHRQVTEAATEWERHQRDEGLLYRGVRLAAWQDRPLERLNDIERAFLTASRLAAAREHRSRRQRVRWAISGLTTATALVTVLAVIALAMAARADDERALAVGRQLATDARAQLARDPELALLLAREAYATAPNSDTENALRQATADSHIRATLRGPTNSSGQPDPMIGVAFQPDGKHLVTSSSTERRVWDWAAGRVTQTASPALNYIAVESIFSPDGRRVAETDAHGQVRVWDWSRPGQQVELPNSRPSMTLAFSPDGQRVASGNASGGILIWDAKGGSEPQVVPSRLGVVPEVAFSPDGRRVASADSAGDGSVRVWDLASGANVTLQDPSSEGKLAVAFSPDGNHVATANAAGAIQVWDPTGVAGPILLGSHADAATSVAYSPDGREIVSTGVDGTVRIWNATQPAAPLVLRGHDDPVAAAAFSPDGKFVASAGSDGTARVWIVDEVQDLTVLHGHQGPVHSLTVSPDGQHITSGGQDGTIRIWNTTDNDVPTVLPGNGQPVVQVTFSPDGGHLAAVYDIGNDNDSTRVWNTRDLTTPTREVPGGPVAFSPDGEKLAVDGVPSAYIWTTSGTSEPNPLTPKVLTTFNVWGFDRDPPSPMAWSPDGEHIASVEKRVQLWDLRKPDTPDELPGPPRQLRALTFSPNGTHLAGAGEDGTVYLWTTTNIANPSLLTGHQGPVTSATFSTDGRHLLTSGEDATVRIWPTDGSSQPLVLDGFRTTVQAAVPLPNGRYVTAHADGTIRIWRCPACEPINEVLTQANQHITRELTPQERRTYLPNNP